MKPTLSMLLLGVYALSFTVLAQSQDSTGQNIVQSGEPSLTNSASSSPPSASQSSLPNTNKGQGKSINQGSSPSQDNTSSGSSNEEEGQQVNASDKKSTLENTILPNKDVSQTQDPTQEQSTTVDQNDTQDQSFTMNQNDTQDQGFTVNQNASLTQDSLQGQKNISSQDQEVVTGQTNLTTNIPSGRLTPPGARKSDEPLVLSIATNYTLRATIPGTNNVQGYLCLNSTSMQLSQEPARDVYNFVLRNDTYPSCIMSAISYTPDGKARTSFFFPYAPGDAFIFASDSGYASAYQRKKRQLFSVNLGLSMDLDIRGTEDAATIGTTSGKYCIGIKDRAPIFQGSSSQPEGTPLSMKSCDELSKAAWAIEPVQTIVPDDNPEDSSNAGKSITTSTTTPPSQSQTKDNSSSATSGIPTGNSGLSVVTAAFSPPTQQGGSQSYMCASLESADLGSRKAGNGSDYYIPILRDQLDASCVISLTPSPRVNNAFTISFAADTSKASFWYLGSNQVFVQKDAPVTSSVSAPTQDWYVNGTAKALTFASASSSSICLSVLPEAKHFKSETVTGADAISFFSTVDCGDDKAAWTATFDPKVGGTTSA
ncbi:MAG: hypothetical protein DHS80DRAFT_23026 [Piptocephalis tieghemiana]|nr:MAG: hypothetical protein DHS80DRAFT_23026 [Piptocephalis tieghemiana]